MRKSQEQVLQKTKETTAQLGLKFSMNGLYNFGEREGEDLLSIEKLLKHFSVQDQRKERNHSVSFSINC